MNMKTLLCLGLLVWCAAVSAPAAEDEMLMDESALAATNASAAAPDEGAAAESEEPEAATRFTLPSARDVGQAIVNVQPGLESAGYAEFANIMNLENEGDIADLYNRFRAIDQDVYNKGKSAKATICEGKYDKPGKMDGTHFDIIFPKALVEARSGEDAAKYPDPGGLLSAADNAFERTVSRVMMTPFMNWAGKVKGRIYLVTSDAQWKAIRQGVPSDRPVQVVLTQDDNREFYVLATPYTTPYLDEALSYAVAELVLKEYAKAIANERRPNLPPVFLAGVGANIANLESVLTEEGPAQVETFDGKRLGPREIIGLHKQAAQNSAVPKQLPLKERDLIDLNTLTSASSYGKNSEQVYYFVRQSTALMDYLQANGALAFLAMTKGLAEGKSFEKAFDDYYVDLRDTLLGKVNKSGQKQEQQKQLTSEDRKRMREEAENRAEAEDVLTGYKELRRGAEEAIFHDLTEKAFIEERQEQMKSARGK